MGSVFGANLCWNKEIEIFVEIWSHFLIQNQKEKGKRRDEEDRERQFTC